MLYLGECPQTFWGMSPNIPGNVLKHSGECRQTFRGMSPNIPGECHKTFWRMSPNILGNALRYSEEFHQTFQGMSSNIPRNVLLLHCFCTFVLWQQGKYLQLLGESNQDLPVRPHRHNHYAIVNWWVVLTHYVDFQLALHKTLFRAIAIHSLANNTLPTLQKTKLDILPLPPLLFYKGFKISKLISFLSRETVADH